MILNTMKKTVLVVATFVMVLGGVGAFSGQVSANPAVCNQNISAIDFGYRYPTQSFAPGGLCLHSASSNVFSIFQSDGNFVTYLNGRAIWQSHTYGQGANRLVFQRDSNVVIYRADNTPLWNTHTNGKGGTDRTIMQQLTNSGMGMFAEDQYSERRIW